MYIVVLFGFESHLKLLFFLLLVLVVLFGFSDCVYIEVSR